MSEQAQAQSEPKVKKVKEVKEKVEKITQNGVTRPGEGTATGQVWSIAEKLSNDIGAPAKRADVMKACEEAGINAATVATQYGKWRKFHGIVAEPKAPKAPKAEVAPAEAGEPVAA